jgi:hypothetical protein
MIPAYPRPAYPRPLTLPLIGAIIYSLGFAAVYGEICHRRITAGAMVAIRMVKQVLDFDLKSEL